MKLFFDEDIGPTIARRIQTLLPEDEIDYVGPGRTIEKGTSDTDWLRYAGTNEFVVISCNRRMLRVPREIRVLVEYRVAIVFVSASANLEGKVALLMARAQWLRAAAVERPRPFAVSIQKSGRIYDHPLQIKPERAPEAP